jgi:hypothetical protein
MCRKFVLASTLEKIESRFRVRLNGTLTAPPSYSIIGSDLTYVITIELPYELQVNHSISL